MSVMTTTQPNDFLLNTIDEFVPNKKNKKSSPELRLKSESTTQLLFKPLLLPGDNAKKHKTPFIAKNSGRRLIQVTNG